MNCAICNSTLFNGIKNWHFYCKKCRYECSSLTSGVGSKIVNSQIDEVNREAGLRNIRVENFRLILKELAILRSGKGGTLLDVGCAHGWFLTEALSNFKVLGIEPDESLGRHTSERGLPIRLGFFPQCLRNDEKFDCIVFNDVFEHFSDLNLTLNACSKHLIDDGQVIINLPSSDGFFYKISKILGQIGINKSFDRLWQKGLPSPHIHYFNTKNLNELMRKFGFESVLNFSIPSVKFSGLWARLRADRNTNFFQILFLYSSIILALPFLKILPKDARVNYFKKSNY